MNAAVDFRKIFLYSWFTKLNLPPDMSATTAKKLQLTNQLAMLFFIMNIVFLGLDFAIDSGPLFRSDLWYLPLWSLVPYWNRSGYTTFSRLFFLTSYTLLLTLRACTLGPEQHVQYGLYACCPLGLVLFETKDRWAIIYSTLTPILAFFLLQWTDYSFLPKIATNSPTAARLANDFAVFFALFAIVAYFYQGFEDLISRLKENQSNLRQAQRLASMGSWEWTAKGREYVLSKECRRLLFGTHFEPKIDPSKFMAAVSQEDREFIRQAVRLLLQNPCAFEHEIQWPRVGGRAPRIFHIRAQSLGNASAGVLRIHGTIQDVTELRKAQRIVEKQKLQIISTSKMSSLGQMAGDVAHEINTPLSVIALCTQHIIRSLAIRPYNVDALVKRSEMIENMVVHISKIIQGLSALARGNPQSPMEIMDVKKVVEDTLILASHRFETTGVSLRVHAVDPNLVIKCQGTQIGQVLLNLLNNSFDAVSMLDRKWVEIECVQVADRVHLMVTDSGPGIPLGLREKIMNPFFTTKAVGKGTGLGLSISSGILESHGGQLRIDTNCVHTRFILDLPKPADYRHDSITLKRS